MPMAIFSFAPAARAATGAASAAAALLLRNARRLNPAGRDSGSTLFLLTDYYSPLLPGVAAHVPGAAC
jgi:hypothetical protein